MKSKDWKERLKVNDGDWFGLSLFIDGEGIFDEYKAGGVLVSSAEEKLKNFIEEVREEAREEGIREGFIFGYGKGEHSMSEFLEHKWDIPHSSRMSAIPDEEIDKALESLTKLTTK